MQGANFEDLLQWELGRSEVPNLPRGCIVCRGDRASLEAEYGRMVQCHGQDIAIGSMIVTGRDTVIKFPGLVT